MRVLNGGRPKRIWWSYKITCTGYNGSIPAGIKPCLTKYKLGIEDIVTDGYESYYFICPKCGTRTKLDNPSPGIDSEYKSFVKRM